MSGAAVAAGPLAVGAAVLDGGAPRHVVGHGDPARAGAGVPVRVLHVEEHGVDPPIPPSQPLGVQGRRRRAGDGDVATGVPVARRAVAEQLVVLGLVGGDARDLAESLSISKMTTSIWHRAGSMRIDGDLGRTRVQRNWRQRR